MDTDKAGPTKKNGKAPPNLAVVGDSPLEGDVTEPASASDDAPSASRKQQEIPGTAPKRNRKVENAALRYREAFLERIEKARVEQDKRGHLIMIMQQEKVSSVRITDGEGDEVIVVLDQPDARVKMRKVGDDGDE